MPEVVTLGECMGVLYPPEPVTLDDTRTLLLDIGGAEANLSVALARLGHSVSFISRVGADPFGERIKNILAGEGVDVSGVAVDQVPQTGIFFREWLADGARRVYYYRAGSAASRMQPNDLKIEQFAGARFVHLTGITPALSESCAATVIRAVELAHEAGARVSFDPNYRAKLWSPEAARAALSPVLAQCEVLLMGHEDAQAVLGHFDDEGQLLEHAASLGPSIVVLKRAERGALALVAGRRYEAPAVAVEHVIDPVGAGDGFDAGFLAGLLRGDDINACLALGARVGAASVAALGDYAGYPRE